ncbi:hypothetical protein L6164_006420 [Bauhinia variegata]|uniref:Uncharacterized protein n=1 Tax=Bauhinia variegata TaxID=167791 RepID=A0ACB9PTL0_BAUVA|nr:hypothetical protein L6164_006420 [Bauhinia variegata]
MEFEGIDSVAASFPMISGESPHSYTKNSSHQRILIEASKDLINEAIEDNFDIETICLSGTKTIGIADLGCSVGQNTLVAVQNIIESIENKHMSNNQNPQSLEFQVLFNDHSSNDFNTLFTSLTPSRKYYAAGVPGSFYHRLFPKSSLHFVHCSYALQWMSQVPKQVLDSKSPSWDKNNIHYMNASEELHEAYSAQYKNDMESFLNARAEELVVGGLIVIVVPSVPKKFIPSKTLQAMSYGFNESCLSEMVKLELISQEEVDSFYIPHYYPTSEELEALIKKNGNFSIERMIVLNRHMGFICPSVEWAVGTVRAVTEALFKEKFGDKAIDQLYERYTVKLTENFRLFESKFRELEDLFVILKNRKD